MSEKSTKSRTHSRSGTWDRQDLKSREGGSDAELRKLQDKIEQLNYRLMESKNENQLLKRNLHLAKQMVSKEVGDPPLDFQLLLKYGTEEGHKGRTEDVVLLKKKVQELESQLKRQDGREDSNAEEPQESPSEEFTKKRIPKDRKAFWRMELERRLARESADREIGPILEECSALRKKLDSEKTRFKDLNRELNMLRLEKKNLLDKNEEDEGLAQSFKNLENQLQDTLAERARMREELSGVKARNKLMEDGVDHMKEQMHVLSEKTKGANDEIEALTLKQKQLQETLDNEKAVVKESLQRYHEELRRVNSDFHKDTELLNQLEQMTYERNQLVTDMQTSIENGLDGSAIDLESAKSKSSTSEREMEGKGSKSNQELQDVEPGSSSHSDIEVEENKAQEESGSTNQAKDLTRIKFETLCDASEKECDRLQQLASMQKDQMNEIAAQVVDTGKMIMSKNAEKQELMEKIKKLQKKKKFKSPTNPKNILEELAVKIEAQRDENTFLRSFLETAIDNKFKDFVMYKNFILEGKNVFAECLQDIKKPSAPSASSGPPEETSEAENNED